MKSRLTDNLIFYLLYEVARSLRSVKGFRQLLATSKNYLRTRQAWRQLAVGFPAGEPDRQVWFLGLPTVFGYKFEGMLTLLVRSKGYEPRVIETDRSFWRQLFHRLIGTQNPVEFWRLDVGSTPGAEIPSLPQPLTIQRLLGIRYKDVDVGRITLSNYLYRHKFEPFNLTHPAIHAEIQQLLSDSCHRVLQAEQLFKQCGKPTKLFLLEKGISPLAEIFAVSLKLNIDVIQYLGAQSMSDFVFKRYWKRNRTQHPFSLSEESWARLKAKRTLKRKSQTVVRELSNSYRSGTWFNRKDLLTGKRIKTRATVMRQLGLDAHKKTAVIFSHVLWDATFFYGTNLFETYEDWLVETLKLAAKNASVNWVVKLHPDLAWKLKFESYSGELYELGLLRKTLGNLPAHIKIVMPDTDISTFSFFSIADYCLTVRGTIGIEMACYGIPVITAGTGRYDRLGFTNDPRSRAGYSHLISKIASLPRMSRPKINLARLFAYSMFNLRPWKCESFEVVIRPTRDAQGEVGSNVAPKVASYEAFVKAPDIASLAAWIDSDQIDYLSDPRQAQYKDAV